MSSDAEVDARKRVEELSRCLRDVLGLLALPAIWRGKDPRGIVTNVAEIFESMFPVDVLAAHVRWRDTTLRMAGSRGRTPKLGSTRSTAGFHTSTAPAPRSTSCRQVS